MNYQLLTLLALLPPIAALADTLTGTVRDARTNEPIIGATIASGTTGTATDLDGQFSLRLPLPATLTISFLGYVSQELTVASATNPLDIALAEESQEIADVVVVGYGTQKRTQLTGSVTKVQSETFLQSQSPTFDGALSGAVAGLNITSSSGQPGASSAVRIRGGNSVNASNEPLYVIDGFIYYKDASASKTGLGAIESSLNPLSTVNPLDIESVEVLKDISATAIYGSRGANGVIIVTTKKGKRDQTTASYRFTGGIDAPSRYLDLMNAQEWARFQKDYFYNKGGYTDEEIEALGTGDDWQRAMLSPSSRFSHELSVSGGDARNRYAFSANYSHQNGIILNTDFRRYNFHLNADWSLVKALNTEITLGSTITYGNSRQTGLTTTEEDSTRSNSPFSAGITNSFVYGLLTPQVVNIYNEDGSYNYKNPYEYAYFAIGNKTVNAISDLENSVAENINNYLLSNVYLQIAVFDFILKSAIGLSREQVTQNYFSPSYTALGIACNGTGGIGNKTNNIWQQEHTLSYSRQINVANYFDALLGFTRQTSKTTHNSILVEQFTNETLAYNNLADGSSIYPPGSGTSEAYLNSLIGRVNYTLLDRYNATLTLRGDNSSRFASSHRWGFFPSVGVSWNADREAFAQAWQTIDALKIRASYGVVGNQEIGDYEYSTSYTAGQYDGSSTYTKSNSTNDNLKWETTASANVGADLTMVGGRLSLIFDAYYKLTSDLLLDVPMGFASGVTSQLQNVGNVENKGVELSADFTPVGQRAGGDKLSLTLSANIALNKNTITDMGDNSDIILGDYEERILRVGEPLGTFYGLEFIGVVQTDEDVASLPTVNGSTPKPGDAKFRDNNGDGKITSKDRVVLGNSQPIFTYGFGASLTVGRWDASVRFAGSYGNDLYNGLASRLEQTSDSYNLLARVLDSWTETNASNRYPYGGNERPFSYIDSRYVEDASYLKLRNLTVGYRLTLPPTVHEASRAQDKTRPTHHITARFFLTASNLLTLTSYTGYDPEVSSGTDTGAYPMARSVMGGIEIVF